MDNATFDLKYSSANAYKLWRDDPVRFNDLDALGHVSSVRMIEFFASARTALFRQALPHWPGAGQIPILKLNVVQHNREIGFPMDVRTGLIVEGFGNTSMRLVMGLFEGADCLALSRNVFVFIDAAARQPVTPVATIKERFLALAG